MNTFDLDSLKLLLCKAAEHFILPGFSAQEPHRIHSKTAVDDLVTEADLLTENFLTQALQRAFPYALIIGEEAVYQGKVQLADLAHAELAFIIDPIDGTWNFAHNLPVFGVMIAVTAYGESQAGLIYYPLSQEFMWAKRGQGAFLYNNRTGSTSTLRVAQPLACSSMSGFIPLSQFDKARQQKLAQAMPTFERISSLRCSSYEYRFIAQGSAHFVLNAQLNPWDHAAGQLIHCEAGGYSALLDEQPYQPTQYKGYLLLAPDQLSWQQIKCQLDIVAP